MRRTMLLVAAMAALFAAIAVPAAARPPADAPGGEDKVTICHATNSLTNPYVVITIDAAAWNPDQDFNGPKHGEILHAREKDGFTWTDVFLGVGEIDATPEDCPYPTTPPTTPPTMPPPSENFVCNGTTFQYGAFFPSEQLFEGRHGVLTLDALTFEAIPAGTYSVTLFSWDSSHPDDPPPGGQLHEQWAADFNDGTPVSDLLLSGDLAYNKGDGAADAQWWDVGMVTIPATNSITATHRSLVEGPDQEPDSVIPLCVGLDLVEAG